jgi:hypothetical protein
VADDEGWDCKGRDVTVHGVRTSQVPRGGEMVPPHLDQHLLHLSRSYIRHVNRPL